MSSDVRMGMDVGSAIVSGCLLQLVVGGGLRSRCLARNGILSSGLLWRL